MVNNPTRCRLISSVITLYMLLLTPQCHPFRIFLLNVVSHNPPQSSLSSSISNDNDNDTNDNDNDNNDTNNNRRETANDKNDDFIRYRARLAYDGTGFAGFQYQPNSRTVQGELESVLSRRFDTPIRVVGAGRTDAGVHARGQVIHFDLPPTKQKTSLSDLPKLEQSLNSLLRHDTRIWNLERAPDLITTQKHDNKKRRKWHAIEHANEKLYSYRLCINSSVMDPSCRYHRTHIVEPIHLNTLLRVLKRYEGTHDFRAFAHAVEQNRRKKGLQTTDTVRTVREVNLVLEDAEQGWYRLDFRIKGALYKMIRNMVGTALDVSKGRMEEVEFGRLLYPEEKGGSLLVTRRDNPCKPIAPEGLTLEWVFYSDF